jgi:signal transduction histidine kinase
MERAIIFGRRIFEETEKLNGPHALHIRNAFLSQLRLPYRNSKNIKEGFDFFIGMLKMYREKNDSAGLHRCHYVLGGFYSTIGLIDQAIYHSKKSKLFANSVNGPEASLGSFVYPNGYNSFLHTDNITGMYLLQKEEFGLAIESTRKPLSLFLDSNKVGLLVAATVTAQAQMKQGKMDSIQYLMSKVMLVGPIFKAFALQVLAEFHILKGNTYAADSVLNICDSLILKNRIPVLPAAGVIAPDYYRALVRAKLNQLPEAIAYMKKDIVRLNNNRLYILRDLRLMAQWYKQLNQPAQEAETYRQFIGLQDSLLADQAQFRNLSFEAEQEMDAKEISINSLRSANKISTLTRNFLIGIAALLFLLVAGIYNRFHTKKKANKVLEETLVNLKSTQSQLIQSEKMASLGELTAGIAHEIQNPLNFVNNFSEVSNELIDEMNAELNKGDIEEAKAISSDIKQNLEKINHHGKRAANIVKGMLQHSSAGSGKKEPTDVNALADEYLRLAYHGLRAKDKSFNATMKTDFDETIGNINIIPQDIGRVILNLITNAFYVVNEKSKQNIEGYEPTVEVSTKKEGNKVLIFVKDNGNGIPQKILDKIFQPFFTTKPTGQGTGLGLSLSYDIVKAHGGELKVETKENEGSTFIIQLPNNTTE